ncbi:hypothetical protein QQF64_031243 [Cirrhinus molitorella]|uniref:Histone H2A/H2B/H3 domain-containing protein n=1 Tax=Cirrhinus molitorella TaxID=172907 RepID=A0ABR3MWD6_9TELE
MGTRQAAIINHSKRWTHSSLLKTLKTDSRPGIAGSLRSGRRLQDASERAAKPRVQKQERHAKQFQSIEQFVYELTAERLFEIALMECNQKKLQHHILARFSTPSGCGGDF